MQHLSGAAVALALGLALVGISGCGLGDDFVSGVGNGGNRFYASATIDEVADVLASHPGVPAVTDAALVRGFEAIGRRAAQGDPEAVLILFRVAERQRSNGE